MMRVALGSPKARSFWMMVSVASLVLAFVFAVFVVRDSIYKEGEREAGIEEIVFSKGNRTVNISRKLLLQSSDVEDMNRIGTACSKDDIVIYQAQVAPLPSGIPSYTVQIMNMCASDCSISSIHVHCGWFSSARLINPRVFRRLGYDDCLVNDGHALSPGRTLSFQYANTYRYPLSVSSVVCRS